MNKILSSLLMSVVLCGCTSALLRWEPQTYTVQRGDTLYSIAWRYSLDYRQLAAWNGIGGSYLIHPGQTLQLQAPTDNPAVAAAAPNPGTRPIQPQDSGSAPIKIRLPDFSGLSWQWPTEGTVLAKFEDETATGKGIDIGGSVGQEIRAAAGGQVVYSGSGLIGYGKLIIIKHNDQYLSAYAHNSEMFVSEGTQVKAGDRIAVMGTGPGRRAMLHFEIRNNGKSVDPLGYLPQR